jgi:hypothetical protein
MDFTKLRAVCSLGLLWLLLAGCGAGQAEDPCQPNPCLGLHKGDCLPLGDSFRCMCDTGYAEQPNGDCVPAGVCAPNPCREPNRTVCQVQAGEAVCLCDAGFVFDAQARCVPDPCAPNPCQEPGRTRCENRWGEAACRCDEGLIENGLGQCVLADPCQPNPCQAPHRTRCVAGALGVECRCEPGYVEDGQGACVRPCELAPCQTPPRTLCANRGESAVCLCAPGTLEDAAGVCQVDPCVPNPCGEPRRTACVRQGAGRLCACDPGYRDEAGACVRAASQVCSAAGLCLEHPAPTADELQALWIFDRENVLAVGRAGRVLHWDGQDAIALPTGSWLDLHAIHGLSLSDIWAVGQDGLILHYDGLTWEIVTPALDPPASHTLRSVRAAGPRHVAMGGDSGSLIAWDGQGWERLETGLAQGAVWNLWAAGPYDLFGTGDFGRHFQWDGEQVHVRVLDPLENLYGLWAGGREDQLISTSSGRLWRFDGQGFERVADQIGAGGVLLFSVWTESPGIFWTTGFDIMGYRGVLYRWGGDAWQLSWSETLGRVNAVQGYPDEAALAVGANGLFVWAEAGQPPRLLGEGRRNAVQGLAIAPDGTPWAAGLGRMLLEHTPEGWRSFSFPGGMPGFDIFDLAFGADGRLYLACADGRFYRRDGQAFSLLSDGNGDGQVDAGLRGKALRALWPLPGGEMLVAGSDGLVGLWDGTAWQARDLSGQAGTRPALNSIWGTGPDDIWAVGEKLGVFHRDANGWRVVQVPRSPNMGETESYHAVRGAGPDDLTLAGNLGAVVRGQRDGSGELVFRLEPSMTTAGMRAVAYLPDGSRLVAGTGGTLLRAAPGGGLVAVETGTRVDLRAVLVDPAGAWLVGGTGGGIFRKAP